MERFLDYIKKLSFWHFVGLFVFIAIILSEALIVIQSYLLHGEIHSDLLIIGFLTPAIDAFVVFFITGLLLIKFKTQELKLVESESRLHESQRYARLGHWEISDHGKAVYWSAQMFSLYGLSPDITPGLDVLRNICDTHHFSRFTDSIQKAFETGKEHHVELLIWRPSDGEKRWIECRGMPIVGKDGKTERIKGFVQDITERKLSEQALKEKQTLLETAQKAAKLGHYITDIDEGTWTNDDAFDDIFGIDSTFDRNFTAWEKIIHPSDRNHVMIYFRQSAVDHIIFPSIEYKIIRPSDGEVRWIGAWGYNIFNDTGQAIQQVGVIQDISERKKDEEKLRLYERVFNDTHEGIIITDAQANIIDINPAFITITGYEPKDVIGKTPNILNSRKHSDEFFAAMWQTLITKGHWQGEIWNRKKNNDIFAEILSISAIKDNNGQVRQYVGIFTDITQRKKYQEQLQLMAHYDALTGLPNRVLLEDRFKQAILHSKRNKRLLAICFLDLDDFKPVNDNYGHDVGDKLLVQVASRIRSCIRSEDTVSRQGGDEFALLINDIETLPQCEEVVERLLYALSQPFIIASQSHVISSSIGITLYPEDNGDIDTLMRHADQAMYSAKIAGKNQHRFFSATDNQLAIDHQAQLQKIKQALANCEFTLYYQPKVNMGTGEVFGVEALIRWNQSDHTIVPPNRFLPIIERTELEIELGGWVIKEALRQLYEWNRQDIKLQISINISSHHLQSKTFFSQLSEGLEGYPEINSDALQLEILESSALGDIEAISHIINKCRKELGIEIALDDFGTGYSSLTHLCHISANTIKIDRSFVRDILDDPNDVAIIDGVIRLADSLNREVIAEGVETTDQGKMLLLLGCELAQGYGIARPMPAETVLPWLAQYRPNQEWMDCADNIRDVKAADLKALHLILKNWKDKLVKTIRSEPDQGKCLPIMDENKCLCGALIARAKRDRFHKQDELQEIEHAHTALHQTAKTLMSQYQKDHLETAWEDLASIEKTFDALESYLESHMS